MSSGNDRWNTPPVPRSDAPPRRRKAEDRPPRREDRPAAASPPPSTPPRRETSAPPRREPAPPETADSEPATRLDTNDLMALAQMDPAEIAALMAGTFVRKELQIGARVTGRVTRVGRDTVFVDLGGKSEGLLERPLAPNARPGDELTAYVATMGEHGIELALTLSGRAASEHLEEARASGLPVEGKITARNAGGFEVKVGSARAFCPTSLISRIPEVDLDAFVGQTLPFRVVETGDKVVVNRRVLQEEEAEKKAEALWPTLQTGQQHRGTVRSVQDFGFFVDIGGVDGLVPRREISWASGTDPRSAVRIGQAVEVVILEIDQDRHRLTLSVKALESDPWHAVGSAFTEGGIYAGTVVRAEAFGCFVELAPGLSGLVHVSKLGGGAPEIGSTIDVRLLAIDSERRRLELSPVTSGEVATGGPETVVKGTVMEVMRNGVSVQLADGRMGWLPESEADLPAGTVLAQRFRRGKPIEARIVRDDRSKPTLSIKLELDDDERNWRSHQVRGAPAQKSGAGGAGFGTLADLLGGLKR